MSIYDHESADALVERLTEALREIQRLQPDILNTLRRHGIRFTNIGADPQDWQHVAFTIYSALCEAETLARNALDLTGVEPNGKGS